LGGYAVSIFNFEEHIAIGEVRGVDTSQIFIRVTSAEKLAQARVGRLVVIQGQDKNEWVVGLVNRVWRDPLEYKVLEGSEDVPLDQIPNEMNTIQVTLVGTYLAKHGTKLNHFTRAILSLPDINRLVFPLEGTSLEQFMSIIGNAETDNAVQPLEIGVYTLDRKAKTYLDADKLFQRHAALLGSTGSGKSWSVATLLEQASKLKNSNIILFDLHGEYNELPYAQQLKIAGPGDLTSSEEGVLFLPFWLMNYEEIQSLIIDYSEQSAPNQSMAVLEAIVEAKKETLISLGKQDVLESFTVNSPIPFRMERIIDYLNTKNSEEVETGEVYKTGDNKGQPKTKQGPLFDKLTRMLIRLKNKIEDRRYGFLFQAPKESYDYQSLTLLAKTLMGHKGITDYGRPGIKVIDFSEVPSDILPIIVSLVARLVYQIQFWLKPGDHNDGRHPILLICDEAHLYLPSSPANTTERKSLESFERIAKEGRKYGVGLFVVSQRPSDVSTTILSQCNNIISLRLTNERDKSVVKNLLPDTLGGLLEVLPGLEVGEAVVVGDSTLLPTRIILNKPTYAPKSSTIDFWNRWETSGDKVNLDQAVENLRKQSRT
jgi:DNA helicase HerA-like ATPase